VVNRIERRFEAVNNTLPGPVLNIAFCGAKRWQNVYVFYVYAKTTRGNFPYQ